MKEATGELNMTVVTVVAIAAVAAFFYAFIWPGIKRTIQTQSICSNGPNYTVGTAGQADYIACGNTNAGNGTYQCQYTEENGGTLSTQTVTCRTK
jgi:hypothetical protein